MGTWTGELVEVFKRNEMLRGVCLNEWSMAVYWYLAQGQKVSG